MSEVRVLEICLRLKLPKEEGEAPIMVGSMLLDVLGKTTEVECDPKQVGEMFDKYLLDSGPEEQIAAEPESPPEVFDFESDGLQPPPEDPDVPMATPGVPVQVGAPPRGRGMMRRSALQVDEAGNPRVNRAGVDASELGGSRPNARGLEDL